MSEATSASADPNIDGGWHYEASRAPSVDYATKALRDRQDEFYKEYPNASRNGHIWRVRRIDDEGPPTTTS